MESRSSRVAKPSTATAGARPANRSQNRITSRGARKNSRVACKGDAYQGSTGAGKTQPVSGRVSDISGAISNNKMPTGRTSEMFNPIPTKQDGFFVHKRGVGAYGQNN